MSKKNFLFETQPALFLPAWIAACLFLLPVLGARADDATNAPANISTSVSSQTAAASTSGNGTNQDLTAMSLEQLMQIQVPVVETASKFEQKATEAPADATVITSDEIKKYGWRTLGDLLGSVPGFYISYDHVYDYVGVSGVNLGDANNRILLLVNGHRINNDLNDSAPVDTSFILDMDLIDRVEIIRGPGSVLYGNNAFFAVINVITRQGKQINGVEGSGTYGSYNEGSGRFTVGDQFTNGLQFLLSGTIYNNNGVDDLDFPEAEFQNYNNGVAHHMDADNFQSFFGSVSYWDLTLEGGYINRDKVNPTAILGTAFNDSQAQAIDDRSYVTLKYDHEFDGGWEVLGDAYYDRSDKELDLPLSGAVVFSPGTTLVQEQETGQWAGTEVQVNKKILDKDTLTFGGEYRNDFEQDVKVYENGAFTDEPIQTNRQNYGIFGQGDVAILDNLHLNAGVRYDEYGNYTPDWSPRAAVIYNPWQPSTFKFIYGTAFRDPNVLELGNATDVQPEKISSYQFIYEQGINRFLRSSVIGYYDRMDNLIGLNSSATYGNFNADTLGLETSLEAKWKNISARLSYSLQRTENRDTDDRVPDSPENMIKFNVSAPLYSDKIFAGLEVQYTSQSKTVMFVPPNAVVAGPNSPGFTVVNFTLFSQDLFIKNLELSASVYNLLNTKFYEPSSNYEPEPYIQQNGINFRLKLTYRF
ncbi:MAG TPA: TonB-dependent receptor [Candidatus Acidoferrales bacterium]|jgi:outer membrane receptor for ferrienterochelin and colicins|nr:TonB-dependent receptor [Candidatus Acidoferrales bacterium]